MCGLVGMIKTPGSLKFNTRSETSSNCGDIMEHLLILGAFRGPYSTGMFCVNEDGEISTFKRALHASDFVQQNLYRKLSFGFHSSKFIVGHNRFATQGNISDSNAHPFQHKHITLVHNGHIHNWKTILNSTPHDGDVSVDSEAICIAIAELGAKEVLEQIQGDFCFIYHDAKNDTLNFVRNKDRPLFLLQLKNNTNTILFASEKATLQFVASRLNLDILSEAESLQEKQINSFTLKEKKMEWTYEPVKFADPPPIVNYNFGLGFFNSTNTNINYNDPLEDEKTKFMVANKVKQGDRIKFQLEQIEKHQMNARPEIDPYIIFRGNILGKLFNKPELNNIPCKVYGLNVSCLEHFKEKDILQGKISNVTILYNKPTVVVDKTTVLKEVVDLKQSAGGTMGKKRFIRINKQGDPYTISQGMVTKEKNNKKQKIHVSLDETESSTQELELLPGPERTFIKKELWEELIKEGCANCTGNIREKDANKLVWIQNSPLCQVCASKGIFKE